VLVVRDATSVLVFCSDGVYIRGVLFRFKFTVYRFCILQ